MRRVEYLNRVPECKVLMQSLTCAEHTTFRQVIESLPGSTHQDEASSGTSCVIFIYKEVFNSELWPQGLNIARKS